MSQSDTASKSEAASGEGSTPSTPNRVVSVLDRVRADSRLRIGGSVAAVVVGVLLSSAHWVGLVFGGALVGLFQRDLKRAIGGGLAFGVVVLLAFVFVTPRLGLGEFLSLTPVVYVTLGAALGLPILGALSRGVR